MKRIIRLLIDIAVALLAIGGCVALHRFGIMPLLQAVVPLNDLQATVLRRAGVMVALFFGYWLAARYHERRSLTELSFRPAAITIGAVGGTALIGVTLLSLYAIGSYRLLSYRGLSAAPPIIVMILLAAMIEEAVFRGVIFRLLEKHTGTVIALAAQALLFGSLHLFNEGAAAMTAVSVTLLGAFWAAVYIASRNLWVVTANHFAWNVMIFVTGVPLSGREEWRAAAPFESSVHGTVWLTGGDFGPEDSIINIVVMTCALAGLLYWLRKRGALVKSAPANGISAASRAS